MSWLKVPYAVVTAAAVCRSLHLSASPEKPYLLHRGSIYPQPRHKSEAFTDSLPLWVRLVFLPFRPVVSAYGGLGRVLERIRVGIVVTLPDINYEVTMGVASIIPGTKVAESACSRCKLQGFDSRFCTVPITLSRCWCGTIFLQCSRPFNSSRFPQP